MDKVSTLCGTDRVLSVTLPTDGEILLFRFLDHRCCVSALQIWSLRCTQAKGGMYIPLSVFFFFKLMYSTYLRARHFFCWSEHEGVAVCQPLLQICSTAHLLLLDSTNIATSLDQNHRESFQMLFILNAVHLYICVHIRGLARILGLILPDVVIILAPHELEHCNQTELYLYRRA